MKIKDYKKNCQMNPVFPYIYVLYDLEQLKSDSFRKKLDEVFRRLKNNYEYVIWNCSYIYKNQNYMDEIKLIKNAILVILLLTKDACKSTYLCKIINTSIWKDKDYMVYFLDDSKKEDLIQNNNIFLKLFDNQESIYKNYNREAKLFATIDRYNINFNNLTIRFRKKVRVYSFLNKRYRKDYIFNFLNQIPSNKKCHKLKKIQDFVDVIQSNKDYKIILILPFLDEECINYLILLFKKYSFANITILFKYFEPQFKKKQLITEIVDKCNLEKLRVLIEYFITNFPNVNFIGDVFFNNDNSRYFNYFYSNKELINLCKFKSEGGLVNQNDFKKLRKRIRKNYIFVSYSHKDKSVKFDIDYLLNELKYNIIIDYDYFLAGDIWTEEVQKLISNDKCIMVLAFNSKNYSSNSISSELDLIKKHKKKLVVINLDESLNETIKAYEHMEIQNVKELPQLLKKLKTPKNRDLFGLIVEIFMVIFLPIILVFLITFIVAQYSSFLFPEPPRLEWWDYLYYIIVGCGIACFSIFTSLIPLNINRNYQKYNLLFYSIQVEISIGFYFIPNFHLQYLYLNSLLLLEGISITFVNLIRIIRKKSIKSISIGRVFIFILQLLILLIFRFLL